MHYVDELPVNFNAIGGLTDEELLDFCTSNDHLRIERDALGNIIIMAPTYSETGEINFNLAMEIGIWNKEHQLGKVYDSSSGFILPNSAMRSPDVAFILHENLAKLSAEQKKGFYKICPDFVLELRSQTDLLETLQEKMKEFIANGASFGWIIDPIDKVAFIYDKDGSVELFYDFTKPLKGRYFMSNLSLILCEIL